MGVGVRARIRVTPRRPPSLIRLRVRVRGLG